MFTLTVILFLLAAACRLLERFLAVKGSKQNARDEKGFWEFLLVIEMIFIVLGILVLFAEHHEKEREQTVRDALDDEIKFLRVEIALREPVLFSEICPVHVMAEFTIPGDSPTRQGIRLFARDMIVHIEASGTNRSPAYSVQVSGLEKKTSAEYGFVPWLSNVMTIVIPVQARAEVRPFEKIRDLRNVQYSFALSSNVANKAVATRVVANDLVVFAQDLRGFAFTSRTFSEPPLDNTNAVNLWFARESFSITLDNASVLAEPLRREIPYTHNFKVP